MQRTVVLNVVGLSGSLIGEHTPYLQSLLKGSAIVKAITPAVTCTMQSTYLTGKMPHEHGIVANGWYFRNLNEIWFWRQSNRLVRGEKIWQRAKEHNPAFTCANHFWWYNMATEADWSITPRPLYCADGRKLPDCYSNPPELREEYNRRFGQFPLFHFWGPATSIVSSNWIGQAAMATEEKFQPTLNLIYLPHLDYCLQRVGPDGNISKDLLEIDKLCGTLIDFFRNRGCRILVLSEYGITPVRRAVHPNRILRQAGYLGLKVDLGREYLDPGASRAFSVSDHQVAHIYIRSGQDIPAVAELFKGCPGVARVLDEEGKRAYGLNHERSGELVLISEKDAWFTYYFWNDDQRAPDYARIVDIHSKPGYDPCELLVDPAIRLPKLKIGWTLLKKILGVRYLMDVIPLDATLVMGSHGRVNEYDDQGPLLMTTEPKLLKDHQIRAVDVFNLMLDHVFKE
jgi:predicted AlkP superfamily pyrophosphatase or phosphodiesterase